MKRAAVLIILLSFISTLSGGNFTLKSPDLSGQLSMEQVYNGFGCKGKNISPELIWSGEPKGMASSPIALDSPPALVGFMLQKHALAKASLISYYGR